MEKTLQNWEQVHSSILVVEEEEDNVIVVKNIGIFLDLISPIWDLFKEDVPLLVNKVNHIFIDTIELV